MKLGDVGCCGVNKAGKGDQECWGQMVTVLEEVGREGGLDEVTCEHQSGRRKETSPQHTRDRCISSRREQ